MDSRVVVTGVGVISPNAIGTEAFCRAIRNGRNGIGRKYVPNSAIGQPVRVILKNSFGFGGHNASLVFRRIHEQH